MITGASMHTAFMFQSKSILTTRNAYTDNVDGFSTSNKIEVKCFTTALTKSQIVERGRVLGVDYSLIWPCYFGGEKPRVFYSK